MFNIISYIALAVAAASTASGLVPITGVTGSKGMLGLALEARIGSSGINTGGFATFFSQNGFPGACGVVYSDNDLIAAISTERYGNNAVSSLCGGGVGVASPTSSGSVTATITDSCISCQNSNSMDLSIAAFKQIATLDQGIVGITWSFV